MTYRSDIKKARSGQGLKKVLLSIKQMRNKKGKYYERWKAGMKNYLAIIDHFKNQK